MIVILVLGGLLSFAVGLYNLMPPSAMPPTYSPTSRRTAKWLVVLGLVGCFVGAGTYAETNRPSNRTAATAPMPKHTTGEAWVMCQEFINEKLASPGSAKYPAGNGSGYATSISGNRYRFKAHVDSQNAMGAMLRTKFDCTISNTGPDKWRLDNLVFE